MSWQDEARANGYVRAALISNNDAELERNMRAADKAVDTLDDLISGIGRALTEPTPQPKPQTSSVGSLGGLLALGALAGGAYLLGKVFGGSDDKKSSNDTQKAKNTNSTARSYSKSSGQQQSTVVKSSKNDAWECFKLGKEYYSRGQYNQAIQSYTKAIILNPDYAYAYHHRGLAYKALGGNEFNAQSDFNRAIQLGYKD